MGVLEPSKTGMEEDYNNVSREKRWMMGGIRNNVIMVGGPQARLPALLFLELKNGQKFHVIYHLFGPNVHF